MTAQVIAIASLMDGAATTLACGELHQAARSLGLEAGLVRLTGGRGVTQLPDDARETLELVVVESAPGERALEAALLVADRVLIATRLDLLSLSAAALALGVAERADALDRVWGLIVVGEAPSNQRERDLLDGLRRSGVALQTLMSGDPDAGRELLREIAVHDEPPEHLPALLELAQGAAQRPSPTPAA